MKFWHTAAIKRRTNYTLILKNKLCKCSWKKKKKKQYKNTTLDGKMELFLDIIFSLTLLGYNFSYFYVTNYMQLIKKIKKQTNNAKLNDEWKTLHIYYITNYNDENWKEKEKKNKQKHN